MSLSTEKKLALKISLISFFVFLFILGSIIFSSYIYGRNRAYMEFNDEKRAFEWIRLLENVIPDPLPMMFESWRSSSGESGRMWPRKWPRDVIIFDEEKNIIKNDVLELSEDDVTKLFSLGTTTNLAITLGGKRFLVARESSDEYTVFLLHDLSPLHEYYEQLLVIAVFWSILGFFIIFMMANHLAKITITPIREHNRELEAYSHNVAHELRTPLAVMRQNLELLKLKPSDKLISSTDEEISGMERIIDTLLFLAKPGNSELKKETINIAEELKSLTLDREEISLTIPKKPMKLSTHSELFRRVVTNLIDNAAKYKSGWTIELILSEWRLSISNAISRGFSEAEISNLTKAFYQWDSSRSSSGYGLWLALVAKIVEIEWWEMDIWAKDKEFVVTISF